LLGGLNELQDSFPQIGDVRGMGLFCGVDLVKNKETREEDRDLCSYIKNRMRDHRILVGSEGSKDNVLKIRPPLTIDEEGIDMILLCLQKTIQEL
jgi:4-aminobutyrate aminotransferase-like enzyme